MHIYWGRTAPFCYYMSHSQIQVEWEVQGLDKHSVSFVSISLHLLIQILKVQHHCCLQGSLFRSKGNVIRWHPQSSQKSKSILMKANTLHMPFPFWANINCVFQIVGTLYISHYYVEVEAKLVHYSDSYSVRGTQIFSDETGDWSILMQLKFSSSQNRQKNCYKE